MKLPAALKDEPGAVELVRSGSGRTLRFNLRAALFDFDLQWHENRKLKLPVDIDNVSLDGKTFKFLLIKVKRPDSVKRSRRQVKTRKAGE